LPRHNPLLPLLWFLILFLDFFSCKTPPLIFCDFQYSFITPFFSFSSSCEPLAEFSSPESDVHYGRVNTLNMSNSPFKLTCRCLGRSPLDRYRRVKVVFFSSFKVKQGSYKNPNPSTACRLPDFSPIRCLYMLRYRLVPHELPITAFRLPSHSRVFAEVHDGRRPQGRPPPLVSCLFSRFHYLDVTSQV